jgi:ubiquinone/menaquinone biosynthesis C-methylase UbiE
VALARVSFLWGDIQAMGRGGLTMLIERGLQAFLRRYADSEAAAVAPFLRGRRILDLGAGEGYVAAALRRRIPVWVCSADVGLFRRVDAAYVTYDGSRLPFRDAAFDTTLLLLTLHHCAAPETVLDEAVRVTRRRLIVLESVYRNWRERFWLDLLDSRLNRYRHHGQMPVALAFRCPQEWEWLFASRRLKVVATHYLGSWWERLVHHPALFVCEKTPERITIPRRSSSSIWVGR